MKKSLLATLIGALVATGVVVLPEQASARGLVSTEWVQHHLRRPNVVVVDIRPAEQYAAGHIPNAINIPFAMPSSAWTALGASGLLMELPSQTDLFNTLGAAGIKPWSRVVVVGAASAEGVPPAYPLAQTARVADTMIYAGVWDVSILNGGITKWNAEGRSVSSDPVVPTPGVYFGWVRRDMFVSKAEVESVLGDESVALLDNRDAEVYSGAVIEPFAPRAGHIPGAESLPTPLIWNADGTYKSVSELRAMVKAVWAGEPWDEAIVYCGVGGYASGWWFVLTQVLNYRNVGFYDGAAQEWAADPNAPMETN